MSHFPIPMMGAHEEVTMLSVDGLPVWTEGTVRDYQVAIVGNVVRVERDGRVILWRIVPGLDDFIESSRDLFIGWRLTDGGEVIYIYDAGNRNFGYGLNLRCETHDEWGRASFKPTPS